MKRLVRLYPRAWRDRYGAELQALLTDTPTSTRAIADVAAAAGRAHGRQAAEHLKGATPARAGAWAAMAAGLLWATTFLVGWLVDWGRYGTDLGFQILAALAGALVLAQLTMAAADSGPGRPITWLGAITALAGGLLLVVAMVAAIVLEPPLALRLPLSPSAIWDRAMLLVTVGSGVSAVAFATSHRSRGSLAAAPVVAIAAAVLAVALFVPFEADRIIAMTSESGEGGGAFMQLLAPVGWFVTTPLVVAAGIAFGAGWAWIGRARVREVRVAAEPREVSI